MTAFNRRLLAWSLMIPTAVRTTGCRMKTSVGAQLLFGSGISEVKRQYPEQCSSRRTGPATEHGVERDGTNDTAQNILRMRDNCTAGMSRSSAASRLLVLASEVERPKSNCNGSQPLCVPLKPPARLAWCWQRDSGRKRRCRDKCSCRLQQADAGGCKKKRPRLHLITHQNALNFPKEQSIDLYWAMCRHGRPLSLAIRYFLHSFVNLQNHEALAWGVVQHEVVRLPTILHASGAA